MFSNPPPEKRAVYEITRKSMVGPERPQMTIWRLRFAYWIIKATRLLPCTPPPLRTQKYVIRIVFPLQQCFSERALVLCYTYIVCLVVKR